MSEEARVYIRKRTCKGGKVRYHLQWISPVDHKWKGRNAGVNGTPCTDRRRALIEAAKLEDELRTGTYQELRKANWAQFVDDHLAKMREGKNKVESERTLREFGEIIQPASPQGVTFAMIESYVEILRAGRIRKMSDGLRQFLQANGLRKEADQTTAFRFWRSRAEEVRARADELATPEDRQAADWRRSINPNTQATINKKLRYLRAAFNKAIRRGYLARSPMLNWTWDKIDEPTLRIAAPAEQAVLMDAAEKLYGSSMRAFVHTALFTGGRRGELLGLTWDRVTLPEPNAKDGNGAVLFTHTKGKRNRTVPIVSETVATLRRVQAATLKEGGPFIALAKDLDEHWAEIVSAAGVLPITIHDLRRTYITRLIRAGVPLPTVQKLAGHASINTTLWYYNQVSHDDKLQAVERALRPAAAG